MRYKAGEERNTFPGVNVEEDARINKKILTCNICKKIKRKERTPKKILIKFIFSRLIIFLIEVN